MTVQDEYNEYREHFVTPDADEAFASLERDARRYSKAFTEEEEAKHR